MDLPSLHPARSLSNPRSNLTAHGQLWTPSEVWSHSFSPHNGWTYLVKDEQCCSPTRCVSKQSVQGCASQPLELMDQRKWRHKGNRKRPSHQALVDVLQSKLPRQSRWRRASGFAKLVKRRESPPTGIEWTAREASHSSGWRPDWGEWWCRRDYCCWRDTWVTGQSRRLHWSHQWFKLVISFAFEIILTLTIPAHSSLLIRLFAFETLHVLHICTFPCCRAGNMKWKSSDQVRVKRGSSNSDTMHARYNGRLHPYIGYYGHLLHQFAVTCRSGAHKHGVHKWRSLLSELASRGTKNNSELFQC